MLKQAFRHDLRSPPSTIERDAVKILIPIFGFGAQGGYRVLSRLATEWCSTGHQVDFLVPEGSDRPYFETTAGIRRVARNGQVSLGPSNADSMPGLARFQALLTGLRGLRREYDLFLANQAFTPWLLLAASIPARQRVYYIQAYEPDFFIWKQQPVHWTLAKLSYGIPAFRIVNSPIYRRYKGIRSEQWVPPGIDLATFRPVEVRRDADTFTIGCIGRHEPDKGTAYVLSAFEQLYAQDPRYRLQVAFGNLPTGWSHPGAQVVPVQGDSALADFYRSLDTLVAPGTIQHGAVHYPVMEAMACGVPVVTTGYLPASSGNAWIVANRDPAAIVDAIRIIDRDPDDRATRVEKGLADVRDFAWPIVAARMMALLMAERGQ